jgi:hypothetical protein
MYSINARLHGTTPAWNIFCRRLWFHRCLPELIALLPVAARCGSALDAVILAILIRLAWVAAQLIHGAGHTLMRALVDHSATVIRWENLLEHRSLGQMARSLLLLAPIGLPGVGSQTAAWLPMGDLEPWKVRLKASGSLLLHLLVISGVAVAIHGLNSNAPAWPWLNQLLIAVLLSNVCLLLASRSDLEALNSGEGSFLYCGNFGLIAAKDFSCSDELLSGQMINIFHRMGRETELRGAQAGGGLLMTLDRRGDVGFVGHRIVNAKRGDLTPSLEAAFRKRRRRARQMGCRPHPAALLACWHYRFGTSGPPAVRETHWQEWTPARQSRLWRPTDDGRWQSTWQTVNHRITHNGDFEIFEAFGEELDVAGAVGPWLERALHQRAPAVVDSARIAGMMDLLICQGDWFAAVRLAFLHTLAVYPEVPSLADLQRWTAHFEGTFVACTAGIACGQSGSGWIRPFTEQLLALLRQDPQLFRQEDAQLRGWIETSVAFFLRNDPFEAMRQFMEGARGSFGLVVASTTWPDRLVLCSLGQPLTIGIDPHTRMGLYASEPAAVDAVLTGRKGAWRIDLDENAGEIAVLSSGAVRVTSLSLDREVSPEELCRRRHPYLPARSNQPGGSISPGAAARDPVAADIAAIPALLAAIQDDWSNPGSANRQCADALAQLLITKAAYLSAKERVLQQSGLDVRLARSSHVDLLITGVENSLWLGERFATDLSLLMPRLHIRTLSANAVMQALQHDFDSLALARQSVVIVLSHSCRTFASRQVMEACDLMVRKEVIRDFFILTGEPNALQGSSLLRTQQPGEPFSRRLFTTGAGRRRAEPATASVAAMHHTLTQLLFTLSRHLLQSCEGGERKPLGMALSRDELTLLDNLETNLFLQECSEIVGSDGRGQRRETGTSRRLEREGRRWAQHVLETPLAWAIHALYILISVAFALPIAQTLTRLVAGQSAWMAAALVADVGIYIFGPWLWTLLLRQAQGRPLLARTGRRSLVIGEVPWIHRLLTNYISKLFSLSYGLTSLDVQGADVGDHLLHTHAHRVVRGTLLYLGFPDGRGSTLQRAEADAALLAARQADGIRHWGTGPEIVAIGKEPSLSRGPFARALALPDHTSKGSADGRSFASSHLIERLRDSRFAGFHRLLGSYVFFWAMARHVGRLPVLRFKWWRSQSRTRVMTTACPVSAARLDLSESREVAALSLEAVACREQS